MQGILINLKLKWIKALVFVCLFAAPQTAFAQFDGRLPSLAVVTGVANNDTLNVRSEPRGSSADIGDLAPNARVEVLAFDSSGKWARIINGEGNGWIAARFLTAQPYQTSPSGVPLGLWCGGTEPFWGLSLNTDDTLTFSTQDSATRSFSRTWDARSVNTGDVYGIANQDLQAVLRRAQCSDGMSDRLYGWAVDVLVNTNSQPGLLSGCCSAQID